MKEKERKRVLCLPSICFGNKWICVFFWFFSLRLHTEMRRFLIEGQESTYVSLCDREITVRWQKASATSITCPMLPAIIRSLNAILKRPVTACCLPLGTTWRKEQQRRIAMLHLSLLIRGEIVEFEMDGVGGGSGVCCNSCVKHTSCHFETHTHTYSNCLIFVRYASLFEMAWNDFQSLDVRRKLSFQMTWNLNPWKPKREYYPTKQETEI